MASARIVVVGAGMAGVATAFHLAAANRARGVVLVDEREPLTLTSNKDLGGYRNWFTGPDPAMVRFMNRSIDLLEALVDAGGGTVRMSRRGYVQFTRDPARLEAMARDAAAVSAHGAGPLRRHPGPEPYAPAVPDRWKDQPDGADLIDDAASARRLFPYVDPAIAGLLHVRRAGFYDAWTAGQWMLMQLEHAGVSIRRDRVAAIEAPGGCVRGVRFASGESIAAGDVVLAAGPMMRELARMLDLELPLVFERHAKLALPDTEGVVPRDAPMLIWNDPVTLEWSAAERRMLADEPDGARLLEPLPGGVHLRSRGPRRELLFIWRRDDAVCEPAWPPAFDPHYGEAVLRAAVRMVPALRVYVGRAAEGVVDGGYYCRTAANRPLVGPLPVEGAWIVGALSGFGVMGCHAAGDLLASHLLGRPLPADAHAFLPFSGAAPHGERGEHT